MLNGQHMHFAIPIWTEVDDGSHRAACRGLSQEGFHRRVQGGLMLIALMTKH